MKKIYSFCTLFLKLTSNTLIINHLKILSQIKNLYVGKLQLLNNSHFSHNW